MKVIILRGGSGSGKSTWTRRNYPKAHVVSADDYFMVDGVYRFDPSKLTNAHRNCFLGFLRHCQDAVMIEQSLPQEEQGTLVVDNTNTRFAEFAHYAGVAESLGHSLNIITFVYDPVAAYKRNTHGTPLKICMAQHQRLMDETKLIPPWWRHDYALWDETWPYASNVGDN